jgi:HK97 family phage major capsid protein
MPTLIDLRQKRNNLVIQGRAIHDLATKEKREMTDEERTNFDKFMDESDQVKIEIDKIEADDKRSRRLADAKLELAQRDGRRVEPDNPDPAAGDTATFKFAKRNRRGLDARALGQTIRLGQGKMAKLHTPKIQEEFRNWIVDGRQGDEYRNLQVDLDTAGGFLVTPQQNDPELIEWLLGIVNGKPTPSGDFLRSIAEAALRADAENYPLLRPALLQLHKKFPGYRDTDKSFPPTP